MPISDLTLGEPTGVINVIDGQAGSIQVISTPLKLASPLLPSSITAHRHSYSLSPLYFDPYSYSPLLFNPTVTFVLGPQSCPPNLTLIPFSPWFHTESGCGSLLSGGHH